MGVSTETVGVVGGMVEFGEFVTKGLYSGFYLFLALHDL